MREKATFGNYLIAGIIGFIISYALLWFLMPYVPKGQTYSGPLYNALKAFLLLLGAYVMTHILSKAAVLQKPLKQAVKAGVVFAILYAIAEGYKFAQKEIALCEEAAASAATELSCEQFMVHLSTALFSFIYCFIVVVIGAYIYFYLKKKRSEVQKAK